LELDRYATNEYTFGLEFIMIFYSYSFTKIVHASWVQTDGRGQSSQHYFSLQFHFERNINSLH